MRQGDDDTRLLSRAQLYMLAVATAVVTANAYYIHPIIAPIAKDFGIDASQIGFAPALNQIALAIGIILLLPLGDRFSNRRLISIFVTAQFFGVVTMALASDFRLFLAGSTLLGFFTIAPYLLPAYVSKRADPKQLGHVTAMLTTGVIAGILVARGGGGIIGEYFGWRAVYYVAAIFMLAASIALPLVMDKSEVRQKAEPRLSYFQLIYSLVPITRQNPEILLSGAIQACSFGVFLAVWLTLGLHLTSAEMGFGVDVVGYISLLAVFNLAVTPRLGKLADRIGGRQARLIFAVGQLLAVLLFPFCGHDIWLLIIPLTLMNLVGPGIDLSGRIIFLSQPPQIRTRLTTVYIALMFAGGGIASWAGTAVYDWGGWNAAAWLAIGISIAAVLLSLWSLRWQK